MTGTLLRLFVSAAALITVGACAALAQDTPAETSAAASDAIVCPTAPPDEPIDFGAPEPLTIVTASGERHAFSVEIADTRPEHARGLMFRTSLGESEGMLFDFGDLRPRNIWMRNTCVSLDILFLEEDGVISGISRRAPVLSDRLNPSPGAARGVLEIAAGRASALGVRPGDRIIHPRFSAGVERVEDAGADAGAGEADAQGNN